MEDRRARLARSCSRRFLGAALLLLSIALFEAAEQLVEDAEEDLL